MALFKDRDTDDLKRQRDERLALDSKLAGAKKDDNRQAIQEITQVLDRRGQRDT